MILFDIVGAEDCTFLPKSCNSFLNSFGVISFDTAFLTILFLALKASFSSCPLTSVSPKTKAPGIQLFQLGSPPPLYCSLSSNSSEPPSALICLFSNSGFAFKACSLLASALVSLSSCK